MPEHLRKRPVQVVEVDSPRKARNDQTVPNVEADASGAPGRVEGARDTSKKLWEAPDRVREAVEREEENPPPEAPGSPDEPSNDPAAPHEVQA